MNKIPATKAERTRETLLLAGEELMGWQGLEAVSVRDINEKAGQKNTSAIRYYFSNKQGLLQAILDRRMVPLDNLRRERLDKLTAEKSQADITLEDLVQVQVLPLAEAVLSDTEWQNYVLLLAQIVSAQGVAYEGLWREKYDKTSGKIIRAMRAYAGDLDAALWQQRVRDMITFCIGSLCERTYEMGGRKGAPRLNDERYLAHLVSTATVILSAPAP